MSYIIGKKCISVCDTSCVKVCPVDAINGPMSKTNLGKEIKTMSKEEIIGLQLYINPDQCIDCGACLIECPEDAIYKDENEAIYFADEESVHKNYEFYGYTFKKR